MTREEVVLLAIKKKATDHFPVTFVHSNQNTERQYADQFGMSLDEYRAYSDSDIKDIYMMDDLNMYISDPVQLGIAFDKGFAFDRGVPDILFDRWGIGWSMHSVGLEVRINPIDEISGIEEYQFPDPAHADNTYMADRQLDEYRRRGYGTWIPQYLSFFERGWALVGYENLMMACYDDRGKVEKLLDGILEYKIKMAERICRYPVVMGHCGDDYGLQRGGAMSIDLWRELFKPRLKSLWNVYKRHGLNVCLHSCGDISMYIDDLIEIGLDILHPVQTSCMDRKELAARYGKDLVFYGGVDCVDVLTNGTPDDVRRDVDATVETLGKHGGLILSAINIMPNVPVENMRALIESMNGYK